MKATETQLKELEKAKPATDAPKDVPPANDLTLFVDDLIRERDRQVCELGKRFTAENSRERGGGRGK